MSSSNCKKSIKYTVFYFFGVFLIISLITSGCIFSGGDSDGKAEKPSIISASISDGQIVSSRDITIEWKGNKTAAFFQCMVDDVVYDTTSDSTLTLTNMEESEHVLILHAFDETLTEKSIPYIVTFTVDAIKGPGIVFSPRKITTEQTIEIFLEDVNYLMAAHIELFCENRCVLFEEFIENKSLAGGGEVIAVTNSTSSQRFTIDIAFAGETEGISGSSIKIGTLYIIPLRGGIITIDPFKTIFRDIDNNTIDINDLDFVRVVQ